MREQSKAHLHLVKIAESEKGKLKSNQTIRLVRHGESQANAGAVVHGSIGDYAIELTDHGFSQAVTAGQGLRSSFSKDTIIYTSPYKRARSTLDGLFEGLFPQPDNRRSMRNYMKIYEDPRLREVDHGYSDIEAQESMRAIHGWFYYRFKGGESPADCYDRICTFLESMWRRSAEYAASTGSKPDILIVSHGLTIRAFVARFMHLSVEQFETLANPRNCDIITIGPKGTVENPLFENAKWAVSGLRLR